MNTYIMEIIDLGNQEVIVQIIKIYSISEETYINIDIVEFYQPFIFCESIGADNRLVRQYASQTF